MGPTSHRPNDGVTFKQPRPLLLPRLPDRAAQQGQESPQDEDDADSAQGDGAPVEFGGGHGSTRAAQRVALRPERVLVVAPVS